MVHIWEDDLSYKLEIILNKIRMLLVKESNKFKFDENCSIEKVQNTEAEEFLEDNHLLGYYESEEFIGIKYKGVLIDLIAFKCLDSTDKIWEIKRLCNFKTDHIEGGFKRILDFFIENNSPRKIIGTEDYNFSDRFSNIYEKWGFNYIGVVDREPDWQKGGKRYLQKNLDFLYEKLKINSLDIEVLHENGYNRIWGCGNLKYEKTFDA